MENIFLHELIASKTGEFLRSARTRTGLSLEESIQLVGYSDARSLERFEQGLIPCCEFIRITKRHGVPKKQVAKFLLDLQCEVYLMKKSDLHPK